MNYLASLCSPLPCSPLRATVPASTPLTPRLAATGCDAGRNGGPRKNRMRNGRSGHRRVI